MPGCPRGYNGPGGLSQLSKHASCTGGIHRYIDIMVFSNNHFYQHPTCQYLYDCGSYDPEGLLGTLTACTLTYLGLVSGRIILHFNTNGDRLRCWGVAAFFLLLLAGILCGFSQNEGIIPINKNLWSTSFGLISAGGGLVGLGLTYVLVDVYQLWSGFPFNYLGMNSILAYCCHGILRKYFPFSYSTDSTSHAKQLMMNFIGASCWLVIAYYCYRIKFFVKV